MVLRLWPNAPSASTAPIRESGIAVALISAVRQSARKTNDDEDAAQRERLDHVVGGLRHEVRRAEQVGAQGDPVALQAGAHLGQGRLHLRGHVEGVGAVLRADHQQHARSAVDQRRADRRLGRGRDVGDVAEHHARPALVDEHGARHRLRGQGLALGLQGDALIDRVDEARPAHARGLAAGGEHVVQADAEAYQILRPDLDAQRADVAAIDQHFADAGRGEQAQPQAPVGDRAQVHQRVGRRGQAEEEHRTRGRGQRGHGRRQDALGQPGGHRGEALVHELARPVDVAAGGEGGGDDRQALDRVRAQGRQPRQAADRHLQSLRHQHLDLLRIEAGRLGLHRHRGRGEFRKDVVLGRSEGDDAVDGDRQDQRQDDAGPAHREDDQGGLEARGGRPRRGRSRRVVAHRSGVGPSVGPSVEHAQSSSASAAWI
jgi:hypothetical protein